MSIPHNHILTRNILSLKKTYLTDVVLPVVTVLQKKTEQIRKQYCIAGKNVELFFYSQVLYERLHPAISHLDISHMNIPNSKDATQVCSQACDLTVHVWDMSGTGVVVAPPWSSEEYVNQQEVDTERNRGNDFLGVYLNGEESISLYDISTKTAYFFIQDVQVLPTWVDAAPLRTIFHWFLAENNIYLLHGAVVGIGEKAALLTARGGSGKSTTSMECIRQGMTYLGDDYVAIEVHDTGARAYSLYSSAKLKLNALKYFPELEVQDGSNGLLTKIDGVEQKMVLNLNTLFPQQIQLSAELVAVLVPTFGTGEMTHVEPIHKVQAFLALAPTTLFQLPLASSATLRTFRLLIERLPMKRLVLGSSVSRVPEVIRSSVFSSI
ncbi:MAG: hypothetical protein K9M11_02505 [Candidatus Pacebacteria bacterium]|nr:hypothetical protein [Candidatus Paceibacterota bacterium]